MHEYRSAALVGVAALCVAGAAVAAMDHNRVMKVDLPDGSIARIEYQGDVAPHVRIEPAIKFMPVVFADPFEPASFDAFERIAADMDRQVETMFRQVNLLEREAITSDGEINPATVATLPVGNVSYRYVSTSDGKSACTRAWQMTSQGDRQPPKIISASYGDCTAPGKPAPAHGVDTTVRPPAATAALRTA